MRLATPALALALAAAPACNVITAGLLGDPPPADAPDSTDTTDARATPADGSIDLPTESLVVYYAFEDGTGTTVTESAQGKHALLSDPAMWTANGRDGGGIVMTGTNPASHFVSLPNDLLLGTDDFTISVWIRMTSNPAWARVYDIGNGLPDPANRFMYLTPNGFTGGVSDGIHASSYGGSVTNESVLGTYTFLPPNVWKHLALTGAGGQRRLYIDGFPATFVENGPAIAPREMEPIAPNSWLGRSRFMADPGFPGSMDEFRVYNRVLTASEIADLAWPKRDYAHWRFDESSGTSAKDSSDHAIPTALATGAMWTTGRLGGAVAFGGGAGPEAGPHLVIAGHPFASCTNQFTIAAWIRLDSHTEGSRVYDFGAAATHSLFLAPTNGTGMHFGMRSPAGTFDLETTTVPVPADSTWHHVAVTMDAGNVVVLFVDGAPIRTQPSPTVRPSDFAAVTEGFLGKSRAQDPYLHGAIDELRIACRAFTPDEIRNLSRP